MHVMVGLALVCLADWWVEKSVLQEDFIIGELQLKQNRRESVTQSGRRAYSNWKR